MRLHQDNKQHFLHDAVNNRISSTEGYYLWVILWSGHDTCITPMDHTHPSSSSYYCAIIAFPLAIVVVANEVTFLRRKRRCLKPNLSMLSALPFLIQSCKPNLDFWHQVPKNVCAYSCPTGFAQPTLGLSSKRLHSKSWLGPGASSAEVNDGM